MIAKRNTRRVLVDEKPFRYKISLTPKSKGMYGLNITVQGECHNTNKLLIEGLIQKDYSKLPDTEERESRFYAFVTQHEVRWLIREAIARGWDYANAGPNFTLKANNDIFRSDFWCDKDLQNRFREQLEHFN